MEVGITGRFGKPRFNRSDGLCAIIQLAAWACRGRRGRRAMVGEPVCIRGNGR
jgi:hypothetical protein